MRGEVYGHLGTVETDRAFPPARVTQQINNALNELCQDMPAGYLYLVCTWAPDGGAGRVYSIAGLAPAVTSVKGLVEVKVGSDEGSKLREMPFRQRGAYDGLTYTITGADEAAKLWTGPGVEEGATLYLVVDPWPAELVANADVPSWLPLRFHDVPCLMAAEVLFARGDEGQMPRDLAAKLLDRRAQLQTQVTRRSADTMKQTQPETVTA